MMIILIFIDSFIAVHIYNCNLQKFIINSSAHEWDTPLITCYIHGIAWHRIARRSRTSGHITVDLNRENDSWHLSEHMTIL